MRRRPVLVLLGLVLAAIALVAAPRVAGAAGAHVTPAAVPGAAGAPLVSGQEPDAPADDGTGASEDGTVDEPLPGEDIIPQPNSGRSPEEAGDRGGALQVLVFVAILVGVAAIVAMIVRESRRNRARRVGAGR
jgi:hypothetical protein